jgi:3-hydroxyacyl-CoA dehydrogenase
MSEIRTVAVLGSGVMGSGIAAHLANCGIPSLVFDLDKKQVEGNIRAALKAKPAPFGHPSFANRVQACDYENDSERLGEADWIVEVVTERLDIKTRVFDTVEANMREGAVVSSNTSGIPLAAMIEGRSEAFRKNFLITHFFNPVRYLRLLELVKGPDTDPGIYDAMARFGERRLGKGIVHAKDTPNFVANRIGTYAMSSVMKHMVGQGASITLVDKVFGKALGRPNSAVFRTADLVGLDTLVHVLANVYEACPDDEQRDAFVAPGFVGSMVERGLLGEKAGSGFYKKDRDADGKRVILALNLDTLEYEPQPKVRVDSLGAARNIDDLQKRLRTVIFAEDEAGRLAWPVLADTLIYSVARLGEISDDIVQIDRALKWGFGWELGPFETWDALGVAEVNQRLADSGYAVPDIAARAAEAGGFYRLGDDGGRGFLTVDGGFEAVEEPRGVLTLASIPKERVLWRSTGATLRDLGDRILGLEFHTKMNAIDGDFVEGMNRGADLLDGDAWDGFVIGSEADNFSAGANVMLVVMAAQSGQWDQIEQMVAALQQVNNRILHHDKPVVGAIRGMTLGGGCEIAMHCNARQTLLESYVGQVELGVGVVPAGGGCKELLARHTRGFPEGMRKVDVDPVIMNIFLAIGTAHVATSCFEAQGAGFFSERDGVTFNPQLLLADAKRRARGMADAGHVRVPYRKDITVAGSGTRAAIEMAVYDMMKGGRVTEYESYMAGKLAWILTGGDRPTGSTADEQHFLDLEREMFLHLCGQAKTQERIQHFLMKGKALRN